MSAGRVFIVDDNPNNLALLAGILREGGYEVRMANSGRRALAAIKAELPELILLDVSMPELDGYQVCAALKGDAHTREVPVLFLSALDDVADKLAAFRAGGVDYVTKPFHGAEVLARVETQIGLLRLRRVLEEKNRELARRHEELAASFRDADRLFAALTAALPGAILDGRYQLDEQIGQGGFAAVYRATHLPSGRTVAVKVLRPQQGGGEDARRERFRREGLLAVRVAHPNAALVLDSGLTPAGISYLVMELLQGRTLAEELLHAGPLSPARCAELLVPVCRALAEAHRAGVLHRDVKPANIFLHLAPGGAVVKVLDFGIARGVAAGENLHGSLTTTGRLLGTPAYMAPERLLGKGDDERGDVYSLGVTAYEVLSGRLPHDAGNGALGTFILACATEPAAPLAQARPGLPAQLNDAVMGALSLLPGERPSLEQLIAALLAAAQHGAPVAPAAGQPAAAALTVTSAG